MSFERELEVLHDLVEQTDAIAMKHFAIAVATEIKADGTPVTVADREIEEALRAGLGRAFPSDGILGEEQGATGAGLRRWIVDPIDGTKNYARGVPVFATLIALEDEGRLVAAMVSAPALRTRWWASTGGGAYCDGSAIRVSAVSSLADADVITGGLDWARERTGPLLSLVASVRRQRGFGDFWGHMLVAQGSADVMVELAPLALWDIAAPKMIVEEAGGQTTGLDGDAALKPGPVITSNGALHQQARALLNA